MKRQGAAPALVLLLVISGGGGALEIPPLKGRVNDTAGVLQRGTAGEIERYLAGVEGASGAQIVLLTVASLEGESLEYYALHTAESWGIGRAVSDNGALLLVAMREKKIRIEVGYGLESVLTDAMSGYIIREIMVPAFRAGNIEAGIAGGLQALGGAVTGDADISAEDIRRSENRGGGDTLAPIFFIVFILIFMLSRMGGYRRFRRRGMSPASALFMGMALGSITRSRHGGGFSGGGGFGGGFSGGGGGFGGGGASGGW